MFQRLKFKCFSVAMVIVVILVSECSQLEMNTNKNEKSQSQGAAGARRKMKPPLIEENGRRRGNKQTHCHFGNQSYELEERWRPDLGQPFGILYCVRCECVAMPRKKRIVAKTRCENIKNVCPKPNCENPVLLPERCCKTCPGEDNADIEEDLAMRKLESDDDDKNTKEYAVLLSGRGLSPTVPASGAGRAYITTSKRHLYYSIILSGLDRPSFVRFLDDDGSILEEHEVASPLHHTNSSKVCGVWRKVPKVYRRLLQKERLSLAITSEKQPEGVVGGKILRNMRINKEVFSSLMIPGAPLRKETLGGGGIAIISTEWNSIYLILDFNGIFLPSDSRDVPVYVQLIETDQVGKPRTVTSSVAIVPKVHPEYNTVSLKMNLSPEAQRLLSTGRLNLRISAKDDAMFLSGKITTRVTCNVFQATMTQENIGEETTGLEITSYASTDVEESLSSVASLNSGDKNPAGSAIVTLHLDGTVSYAIETIGFPDQPVIVALESEESSFKEMRTIASSNETFLLKNKVSGFFPKSAQEVEMLLSDDLFIQLSSSNLKQNVLKLRGRIRQRLYTDAFVNEMPMLLVAENMGSPSPVGQAWLAVDKECSVHYAVYVAGLPIADAVVLNNDKKQASNPVDEKKKERHLVEMIEISPNKSGPTQQKVLQRLNGEEAEDVQVDVDLRTLSRVKYGQVYLAVSFKIPGKGKTVELKAKINNIPIPVTCLPRQDPSHTDSTYIEDESNDIYGSSVKENEDGTSSNKCHYQRESFEDGAQWKAHHDNCMMCYCQRGRVKCDNMVCPIPPCEKPTVIDGECCGVCPGENPNPVPIPVNTSVTTGKSVNRGCYFEGDKKFHLAGSEWHPYIPPFGFSRCALCTCEVDSLSVECKRISCPQLVCAEKDAFRKHPLSCCKQCPVVEAVLSTKSGVILLPGELGDQGSKKTPKDVLALGGCKFRNQLYSNGDVWHPTVQPYGEMKCISCQCKDGRYKCKRQKCPKLSCVVKVNADDECCPRCLEASEIKTSGTNERRTGHRRKAPHERRNTPKEE